MFHSFYDGVIFTNISSVTSTSLKSRFGNRISVATKINIDVSLDL